MCGYVRVVNVRACQLDKSLLPPGCTRVKTWSNAIHRSIKRSVKHSVKLLVKHSVKHSVKLLVKPGQGHLGVLPGWDQHGLIFAPVLSVRAVAVVQARLRSCVCFWSACVCGVCSMFPQSHARVLLWPLACCICRRPTAPEPHSSPPTRIAGGDGTTPSQLGAAGAMNTRSVSLCVTPAALRAVTRQLRLRPSCTPLISTSKPAPAPELSCSSRWAPVRFFSSVVPLYVVTLQDQRQLQAVVPMVLAQSAVVPSSDTVPPVSARCTWLVLLPPPPLLPSLPNLQVYSSQVGAC